MGSDPMTMAMHNLELRGPLPGEPEAEIDKKSTAACSCTPPANMQGWHPCCQYRCGKVNRPAIIEAKRAEPPMCKQGTWSEKMKARKS